MALQSNLGFCGGGCSAIVEHKLQEVEHVMFSSCQIKFHL